MSQRLWRLGGALALAGFVVFALWAGVSKRSPGDPLPSALRSKPVPEAVSLPLLTTAGAADEMAPFLAPLGENGEWPPVTVVNFWGSWCVACESEMPELVAVAAEWEACAAERGQSACPVLVGVAFYDPPEKAGAFLKRFGATYRNYLDNDGEAVVGWGIYGAPETFFIDSNGMVRFRHVGPITAELLVAKAAEVAAAS